MTLRHATRWLLAFALGLPIAQAVLLWVAGLLSAMGDAPGATVLNRLATAASILWLIALVLLVVILAARSLEPPPTDEP